MPWSVHKVQVKDERKTVTDQGNTSSIKLRYETINRHSVWISKPNEGGVGVGHRIFQVTCIFASEVV